MKTHQRITVARLCSLLCLGVYALSLSAAATAAVDPEAALALAKGSGCTKCHAVDKKKDGPAYRDVAAFYKGQADAEARIEHHITSGERVKFDDGHEEDHKKVKSKDPVEIHNLITWILTLDGGHKYTPNTPH